MVLFHHEYLSSHARHGETDRFVQYMLPNQSRCLVEIEREGGREGEGERERERGGGGERDKVEREREGDSGGRVSEMGRIRE